MLHLRLLLINFRLLSDKQHFDLCFTAHSQMGLMVKNFDRVGGSRFTYHT